MNEPIKLSQLRVIKTHDKKVKLFFSSEVTQDNCYIQLREMGSDSIESIGIVESDLGYCANGMVTLDVKQNQRLELNVELERSLLGAAEIYVCREVLIEEAE